MKKNIITVLLILVVPVLAYFLMTAFNKDEVSQAVAQPAKPQVIKFTSTMCLDCQTMNKIMKEIFPKYDGQIVLTEIQVQDGKPSTEEMINKHNVTLVPTIILLDKNGKQIKRIEGAIEKEVMDGYLQGLLK